MLRTFFSYAAAEGLSKGLSWLSIALLPLILVPEEFGIVGLLAAIDGIVSNILMVGQERAIFRFHFTKEFKVYGYAMQLLIVFSVAVTIIVIFSLFFKQTFFNIAIFPHLLSQIISILLFNFSRVVIAEARITENFSLFWKTRVLFQLFRICLILSLCYIFKSGIAYIYGGLIWGFVFLLIYRKRFSGYVRGLRILKFDSNSWMLLAFGIPLIFHAMGGSFLSYADRFFVEGYFDSTTLAVYTFAYSLGASIFFFYGSVSSYFEPLTYRHYNDKQKYQAVLSFYLVFVLTFATIFAIIIKYSYFPVILRYYPEEYAKGYICLQFILAAHLLIPFFTIANFELGLIRKTGFIAVSTVITAIINLTLNYFFIPRYGIEGAAVSSLISYFFLAIITNFWVRINAGIEKKYLLHIFAVFFIMCFFIAATALVNTEPWVSVIVNSIVPLALISMTFYYYKHFKAQLMAPIVE